MTNSVVGQYILNTNPLNGVDTIPDFGTWDIGYGTDAYGIIEFVETEDIAQGSDLAGGVQFGRSSEDTAYGSDLYGTLENFSITVDVGYGTDTYIVTVALFSVTTDLGYGTDTAGGFMSVSSTSDAGLATESTRIAEALSTTSVATGTDASTTEQLVATIDIGYGTDTALPFIVLYSVTEDKGYGTDSFIISESHTIALSVYAINSDAGSGWPYTLPVIVTSLAEFNEVTYIATADGLYALDATDDLGTSISWSFNTGLSNFGTDFVKRVQDVNVLMRNDGDALLRVTTNRTGQRETYDFHVPDLTRNIARDGVTKVGKGLASVYWGIGMVGRGTVEIDGLLVTANSLSRRR